MNDVKMVWSTPGGDDLIAHMARVSNPEGQEQADNPARLIRHLIKHRHWSPFEMVNACFEIETTRDIGRQILRHRSLSFQEFSQRYADPTQLGWAMREARLQHPTNRQASVFTEDAVIRERWRRTQVEVIESAQARYKAALAMGIAKEQARALLPEGMTTTRMYANGTIRSWLHFIEARSHEGAQREVQMIAESIKSLLIAAYPMTMEAWGNVEA